jgi:uncharacterized protein involved in response to NO
LGFRPFFLLAGIAAVALVALWIAFLNGVAIGGGYFDPVGWHRHEMLFGYTIAVVAGFLLTATQNWTGIRTVHGWPLAALAALWLTARVMIAVSEPLPAVLIALVDCAFLPALAVALAGPLFKCGVRQHYVFLLTLGLLFLANLLVHLESLQLSAGTGRIGTTLAVNLLVLLILLLGGRVIPFFMSRALPDVTPRSWAWIDYTALYSVALLAVVEPLMPQSRLTFLVAGVACVSNAVRLMGWQPWRTITTPLLWVLHLAYAWIVLGFALKSLSLWFPQLGFLALHALVMGGIGAMTLGMMARVILGHTGRIMKLPSGMATAFVLINLSVLSRVIFPMILPSAYLRFTDLAGLFWALAFVLFLFRYAPMLVKPRVDGREG